MKRIIVYILLVVVSSVVWAQVPTRVDTSYVGYNTFDYTAWVLADSLHMGLDLNILAEPPCSNYAMYGDVLQRNYTSLPQGLKVVGLAVAIHMDSTTVPVPFDPPESLFLYEATPQSFDLLRQIQWEATDVDHSYTVEWFANWPLFCDVDHEIRYTPNPNNKIYEYYFDTAVVVYDSFYVGVTDYKYSAFLGGGGPGITFEYLVYVSALPGLECHIPPITWKVRTLNRYSPNLPYNQWVWRDSWQYLLTLPIVELIDTVALYPDCNPPTSLFLTGSGTDTVKLHWHADAAHSKYIVKYGPTNFDPATSGISDTVEGEDWVYTGADTRPMDVYVRTICDEYDTVRLSQWSEPIFFMWRERRGGTQDTADVGVPDQGEVFDTYVQLLPNPASDKVLISSSFKIDQIEVYDSRGKKVMDSPIGHIMTRLDVAAWPRGVYVVLLHTTSGTIVKRLVVR